MEKKPKNTAGDRNEDPAPPEKMNGTLFAPAGANSARLFRQSDVPAFSKAETFFFSDTLRQHRAFLGCRRCRTESAASRDPGAAENTARKNIAPLSLRFIRWDEKASKAPGV